MEKFILIGTRNDGYRYVYRIKKEKSFTKIFREFSKSLKLKEEYLNSFLIDELGNEIDVRKLNDSLANLHDKNYDIDIYFGNKEIKMVIRTKKKIKLIKTIEKYTEFIKINPKKRMKNRKAYKAIKRVEQKENKKKAKLNN